MLVFVFKLTKYTIFQWWRKIEIKIPILCHVFILYLKHSTTYMRLLISFNSENFVNTAWTDYVKYKSMTEHTTGVPFNIVYLSIKSKLLSCKMKFNFCVWNLKVVLKLNNCSQKSILRVHFYGNQIKRKRLFEKFLIRFHRHTFGWQTN